MSGWQTGDLFYLVKWNALPKHILVKSTMERSSMPLFLFTPFLRRPCFNSLHLILVLEACIPLQVLITLRCLAPSIWNLLLSIRRFMGCKWCNSGQHHLSSLQSFFFFFFNWRIMGQHPQCCRQRPLHVSVPWMCKLHQARFAEQSVYTSCSRPSCWWYNHSNNLRVCRVWAAFLVL